MSEPSMRCELWRDEIRQEYALLKALLQIPRRGAKWSLPKQSYDTVTLTLQNNELTLRCCDARTIVEVALPCVNGLPKEQSREAQTVTVSASLLNWWLELTGLTVGLEFETRETYPNGLQLPNLRVTSAEGFVLLPIREDAPGPSALPDFDERQAVSLPAAQLARVLGLTRRSLETETQTHNKDCLLLDHNAYLATVNIVGTDGHQMVWLQEPWQNDPPNIRIAIPQMLLTPHGAGLIDYLLAADQQIELAMSGKWLRLKAGLLTVWHHHLELELWPTGGAVYPNYQAVQEAIRAVKPTCTIEVDSDLLRQTLAQIQCFPTKGTPTIPVFLQPTADGLAIKTSAVETLTSGRQLPARVSGASVPICVNPQFLLNLCQLRPSEKLQLICYPEKLPLEVRPVNSAREGLFCCVMPMNGDLDW